MSTGIYDMLVEKITQSLGVDTAKVHPEATFHDLEIDSLAALEMGVIAEEILGVTINFDEVSDADMTLTRFAAYLERLVSEKNRSAL